MVPLFPGGATYSCRGETQWKNNERVSLGTLAFCRILIKERHKDGIFSILTLTASLQRISRASSVLLSDPCFQLHSIQHLLGEDSSSSFSSSSSSSSSLPASSSPGL
ncbi:hypothetical protein F7725_016271 [Dissostichus mawsoni]|uniref:Uncharacterized protein n=1 Tax=Dissostichus mawsoni TaxID=36200 RepID=A0A7J5Z5G0_DISMA|nr:hypothetical protein F7725_016271 [Dissostichus mawsoni]